MQTSYWNIEPAAMIWNVCLKQLWKPRGCTHSKALASIMKANLLLFDISQDTSFIAVYSSLPAFALSMWAERGALERWRRLLDYARPLCHPTLHKLTTSPLLGLHAFICTHSHTRTHTETFLFFYHGGDFALTCFCDITIFNLRI